MLAEGPNTFDTEPDCDCSMTGSEHLQGKTSVDLVTGPFGDQCKPMHMRGPNSSPGGAVQQANSCTSDCWRR